MKGYIFDIKRFCLDNGPGIRTTVFMKGCPLRCPWCHNPESFELLPQPYFVKEKCIQCGHCESGCPTGALSVVGYEAEAAQVMDEVLQDADYYAESGGGVTFSGGEPLFQLGFLREMLQLAKEAGIHTCLDTAGHAAPDAFETILPLVDLVLYDFKLACPKQHKLYTGVDNTWILQNLAALKKHNKPTVLRTPIIPEINDTPAHEAAINALVKKYAFLRVEKMAYHTLGADKLERLKKR